jgi:hypothetical protein
MKNLSLVLTVVLSFSLIISACKKKNDDDTSGTPLTNAYKGQLHLLFSNTFPQFSETTSVDVDVNKEGKMTFGIGGLQYFGEDDNGQSKIRREGELIISPNGDYFIDNDKIHFDVHENTMITETMKVWYWDGSEWKLAVNENISDTWNGGLDFKLIDAEINGSVVETVTANGTVKWTLTLTPIPN